MNTRVTPPRGIFEEPESRGRMHHMRSEVRRSDRWPRVSRSEQLRPELTPADAPTNRTRGRPAGSQKVPRKETRPVGSGWQLCVSRHDPLSYVFLRVQRTSCSGSDDTCAGVSISVITPFMLPGTFIAASKLKGPPTRRWKNMCRFG